MRTRLLTLLVFVMTGVSLFAQAQTYEKMWKSVEAFEKKDLPQSVIKKTNEIYQKAFAEKNSPQMFKAYLYNANTKLKIDADSFYVNLKGLEKWEAESTVPMDKAILNSMIAELYADYAQNNSWQLRKGKQLTGETPEDIREWSANLFIQKAFSCLRSSLKDQKLLQETSSSAYEPIVTNGETSNYFRHDMLHLLAKRALSTLSTLQNISKDIYPQTLLKAETAFANTASFIKTQIPAASEYDAVAEKCRIYKELIAYYQLVENKDAVLLTELERLDYTKQQFQETNADEWEAIQKKELGADPYIAALNDLIAQNSSNEVCAEAYLGKANYVQTRNKLPLALEILNEAIQKYPKYKRINLLKNSKQQILNPNLNIESSQIIYPGNLFDLKVSHRNLDGFKINLYKVNLPVTSPKLNETLDKNFYKKYAQLITTEHYSLVRPVDYLQKDSVFKVKAPALGIYLMDIIPDAKNGNVSTDIFYSSAFKVLTRNLSDNKTEIITLDAQSGQPIPEATVSLFVNDKGDKKEHSKVTTDANGSVVIDKVDNLRWLTASKGNDVALPLQNIYSYRYFYTEEKKENELITLLTDRTLYRPGQTVFVKAIAYRSASDTAHVVANKKYNIKLYDANDKMIDDQDRYTNEFGSFTTEFSLPTATLNGRFCLKTDFGGTYIRVEEYKRPTFEITFQPMEGSYTFNDSVKVKGVAKTFSGVAVQGAPVKYTVTRAARNWWRFYNDKEVTLVSGEAIVDATGNFEVPFQLIPDLADKKDESYYIYKVEATLTDAAGETQTSETSLAVGSRSLILSTDLKDEVCRDNAITTIFTATNLNQKPVNVEGTYQLFKKNSKEVVLTGVFTSNKSQELSTWKELPSGEYKLILSANDEKGRKATFEKEFVLFSVNDQHPPVAEPMWCKLMNSTFAPGKPATVLFGSGEKDVHVLYDVFADGKRIESRRLALSNSVKRFDLPYKAEYGDGVYVNFCFVKNGQVYQQGEQIRKAFPDNKLIIKWDVFRDKLKPGQKEEWKLTIKDAKDKAAKVEFMAAMYDASLDKIWKGNQGLYLNYGRNIPVIYWNYLQINNNYYYFSFPFKYNPSSNFSYDRLMRTYRDRFSGSDLNEVAVIGYGTKTKGLKIRGMGKAFAREEELQESKVTISIADVKGNDETNSQDIAEMNTEIASGVAIAKERTEETLDKNVPVRENFNETAFFYPQLRTNEKGEISFSFTMPESLTRWTFKGIAHTKDMQIGTIDGETVTSKDFMLTPNMPRFVRVGDRSSISARIINVSQKDVAGEVKMQLFDPATEKVILTKKQLFSVKAGQTSSASFEFTADAAYSLLGCRLVADGGTFSDGEQHLLPVLSNKERIIETLAMPIRGNQTREFSMKELFNGNSKTATDRKLTVEFTGNPAWYAVQSLPSLSNPTNESAVSWATAFYANSLASSIMNAQPRIKLVFDQWKAQGETKETLWSNLQKNQDVKNILLEESPWLTEAKSEAEQKQRLALLFDLNTIQYKNTQALAKLKELQLNSGAWTWYKGMNGSRYITQFVLETMGRLSKLTGEPLSGDALNMQQSAFRYLHGEMLQKYKEIKKDEKKYGATFGLDDESLHYLYLCALTGEKIPSVNKEAYNYFLGKVHQTLKSQTLMGKALSTVVLAKAGKNAEAKDFLNSMKEYAAKTDEMGMFYSASVNPYSWFGNKIKMQTAILEAFDEVAKDSATVEEMKMWLLKQKQAQSWDSPVSTVNAVYALLNRGNNLLDNPGNVKITFGKQVMETYSPAQTAIPSTGYIKKSFEDAATTSAPGQIKIEKRDAGIAWGAVYAQYLEETDKVKQQGKELNVSKTLYVERLVNGVKELQPLKTNAKLKVGDKVVSRIIIKVDRDMDFVQLKDQRAACFEPLESLSGYRWGAGTGYYVAVKDASTNFFFDSLVKGTYVLEHSFFVTRTGNYSSGIATLQSAYAPEFASHSSSERVVVE
ncbi:alpha-2-macroglobulin family protein [uncultured Bacteroides sp.]|uniref:alpha-2-macroglobulin family protein n=1 Tax=uncultured Bacteroides sp. TaxID=162156 RepID=UPI002AA65FA1|nr:alpha-2-macroglobulin family protein [uncultured Bacteroides sp.]